MDCAPDGLAVQRYIRDQSWSVEIVARPELADSAFALFEDFVVHRLLSLARAAPAGSEVRYRLLWLLDMHWPAVADLRNTMMRPEDLDAAWFRKRCGGDGLKSTDAPAEGTMDPFPVCEMSQNIAYILGATTLKQSTVEKEPMLSLLADIWPQKHLLENFKNKVEKILGHIRKKKYNDMEKVEELRTGVPIAECLLEWWIAFHLGSYRHSQVAELDWRRRMALCSMWRNRRLPVNRNPRRNEAIRCVCKSPVVLLYCAKEFLIYAVASDVQLHDWLQNHSLWPLFVKKVTLIADKYRTLAPSDQCAPAVDLMTEYLACMHTIGLSTQLRLPFYQFMAGHLELSQTPPPRAIERTIIHADFNREHFQSQMAYIFDRQPALATCPCDMEDVEEVEMCNEVRLHVREPFLNCRRIVWYIMHRFGCHRTAIDKCETAIFDHYRYHFGKTKVSVFCNDLYSSWPREYLVFSEIFYAWHVYNSIWHVPLPVRLVSAQLAAIGRRFTQKREDTLIRAAALGRDPSEAPFVHRRADLYVYCPTCLDHQTQLCQKDCKANSFPEQAKAKASSGVQNTRVDLRTGIPYCARKKGKKAKLCAETPLKYFHTTGRCNVVHSHVFQICPQCGIVMESSRSGDDYNRTGIMCANCARRWETELRSTFDKALDDMMKVEMQRHKREAKEKRAAAAPVKLSGKTAERDIQHMKSHAAQPLVVTGLGLPLDTVRRARKLLTKGTLPNTEKEGTRHEWVDPKKERVADAKEMKQIQAALKERASGKKRKPTPAQTAKAKKEAELEKTEADGEVDTRTMRMRALKMDGEEEGARLAKKNSKWMMKAER